MLAGANNNNNSVDSVYGTVILTSYFESSSVHRL